MEIDGLALTEVVDDEFELLLQTCLCTGLVEVGSRVVVGSSEVVVIARETKGRRAAVHVLFVV